MDKKSAAAITKDVAAAKTEAVADVAATPESGASDDAPQVQVDVPMVEVRALRDDQNHGLVAGELGKLPENLVEAFAAAGYVDTHPDAVAYARAQHDARSMLAASQAAVAATA